MVIIHWHPGRLPTWSIRFEVFCQTKGLNGKLIDEDEDPVKPTAFGATPNADDQSNNNVELLAHQKQLAVIERQENEVCCCYLAIVLDSSSFILIWHVCVDRKGKSGVRTA